VRGGLVTRRRQLSPLSSTGFAFNCYSGAITNEEDEPKDVFEGAENKVECPRDAANEDTAACYKVRLGGGHYPPSVNAISSQLTMIAENDDGDFFSYYGCSDKWSETAPFDRGDGVLVDVVLNLPDPQDGQY